MPKKRGLTASLMCEYQLCAQGYERIAGIDEAGRGTWAGPVAAAAVCLPLNERKLAKLLRGVRDSKMMTPQERDAMVDVVKDVVQAWGIGAASNVEIDTLGIVPATKLAMTRALDTMNQQFPDCQPQALFLDGLIWPERVEVPQVSIIDGDARSLSIAAASVLAKVWRDERMIELDAEYPQYGFAIHKGYGTAKHARALRLYGPCPLHRLTFKPVREIAASGAWS